MKLNLTLPILLPALLGLLSSVAWPHGEDRPGPHGGAIRMPGAFHIEVKALSASEFEVYLLDINWKNPSIQKSSLGVTMGSDTSRASVACQAKVNRFICRLPKGQRLTEGARFELRASREGVKGIPITYDYPFGPPQSSPLGEPEDSQHGSHKH